MIFDDIQFSIDFYEDLSNSMASTVLKRKNQREKVAKKKPRAASLQRTLTDSDIELDRAGAAMSPAISMTQRTRSFAADGAILPNHLAFSSNRVSRTTIFDLPKEILEEIFCSVPIVDLINNVSTVCPYFRSVISDENFLKWKKKYNEIINDELETYKASIFYRSLSTEAGGFERFISLMSDINLPLDREKQAAIDRLRRHPLFESAIHVLEKISSRGGASSSSSAAADELNLGALVATLVMISDGVVLLGKLIDLLTAQPAYCKQIYWIEYFYCALTYLYIFSKKELLEDGRRHYQLQYAMYLFENGGPKPFQGLVESSRQVGEKEDVDNRPKKPTYEQQRIINYNLRPNDLVRIKAFAGTGKTTTLSEYCRARPSERFLVIFFNRFVADDAALRFPSNAKCKTIHRLAYAQEGRKYENNEKDNNEKLKPNLTIKAIVDYNGIKDFEGIGRYERAELIRRTLERYFASDEEEITSGFVPETLRVKEEKDGPYVEKSIDYGIRTKIQEQAKKVWCSMKDQDLTRESVCMTHNGYLKLYQLSKPTIYGCNAILVDEAQDCNPATLDIIKRQHYVPKIFVGDSFQQIYSFRGAINALDTIPSTKTFYLTQSFRFGPEIAFVANAWMRSVLGEKKKFLIGASMPSRLDGSPERTERNGRKIGRVATICRTNYAVFNECVAIATRENRPCLSNGNSIDFGSLEALAYLYLSRKSQEDFKSKPNHWYLERFETFTEAEGYANKVRDIELLCKINIVQRYGLETSDRIRQIKKCSVNMDEAEFIVTTAHKAKGMEFDTVRMANDFADPDNPHSQLEDDDLNIIYVAMTRAKRSLVLNETTYQALARRLGPLFHHPIVASSSDNNKCSKCSQIARESKAIFLAHRPLALTYGSESVGVSYLKTTQLCKKCVGGPLMDLERNGEAMDYVYKFYSSHRGIVPFAKIEAHKWSCFHFHVSILD